MKVVLARLCRLLALMLAGAILLPSQIAAQAGLAMMKVETGARASGMGGAFVSIFRDVYSSAYNPAGAGGIRKFTVGLGHNEYWKDVRIESGYFASPPKGRFTFMGGIKYAALGHLEVRQTPTSEPDALADAHDISFKTGLAYRINDKLFAGFGLGWFLEKISTFHGSAFNLDFGLLAAVRPDLNVGASITNVGSDFTISQELVSESRKISLPTTYRVGASYTSGRYRGAADLVVLDDKAHLHTGLEGKIHRYFAVRVGYMVSYDTKNFSAGASFIRRNLTIDYAFVPYSGGLDDSHQFSFTFEL